MTIRLGPWEYSPGTFPFVSSFPVLLVPESRALLKVTKKSFVANGIRIMDLDNAMEMVSWYRTLRHRSIPCDASPAAR